MLHAHQKTAKHVQLLRMKIPQVNHNAESLLQPFAKIIHERSPEPATAFCHQVFSLVEKRPLVIPSLNFREASALRINSHDALIIPDFIEHPTGFPCKTLPEKQSDIIVRRHSTLPVQGRCPIASLCVSTSFTHP